MNFFGKLIILVVVYFRTFSNAQQICVTCTPATCQAEPNTYCVEPTKCGENPTCECLEGYELPVQRQKVLGCQAIPNYDPCYRRCVESTEVCEVVIGTEPQNFGVPTGLCKCAPDTRPDKNGVCIPEAQCKKCDPLAGCYPTCTNCTVFWPLDQCDGCPSEKCFEECKPPPCVQPLCDDPTCTKCEIIPPSDPCTGCAEPKCVEFSTQKTDYTQSTDKTQPTDNTQPTDKTQSTDKTQGTDKTQTTEKTQSTKATDKTQSTENTQKKTSELSSTAFGSNCVDCGTVEPSCDSNCPACKITPRTCDKCGKAVCQTPCINCECKSDDDCNNGLVCEYIETCPLQTCGNCGELSQNSAQVVSFCFIYFLLAITIALEWA